jgi:hypothetical protein
MRDTRTTGNPASADKNAEADLHGDPGLVTHTGGLPDRYSGAGDANA